MILLIGNTMDLEKQFLEWGIPYVAGFELLLEMSLGRIVAPEQFAQNTILETYDLLEENAREIYTEILANRLAPELAEKDFRKLSCPCEYFNQVYFPVSASERLADCGAYVGDSVRGLLETAGSFEQVWSFEIDPHNREAFGRYTRTLPQELQRRIRLYPIGVWNERGTLAYGNEEKSLSASNSLLKTSNRQEILVDKLDDILKGETVTFLKMDIEGSELPALQGAEHIIRTQKPKLAICLYHKIEDFWEIPTYLHSIAPEYRFGVLHHEADIFYGSVLYAWRGQ